MRSSDFTRTTSPRCHVMFVGLLAAFAASNASAEYSYKVYAGAGHSDNLGREAGSGESSAITTAGARIDWKQAGTLVAANVGAQGDWYSYSSDAFSDEFLGRADADLRLAIVPKRFEWILEGEYGQAAIDPFEPLAPGNRQNIATFATGPDLSTRLGSATTLSLSGRYNDVSYEESRSDYNSWSASLSALHHLSDSSGLGFTAARQHIAYDLDELYPDYDRDQVFLSYDLKGARTTLNAQVGMSRAKRQGETDDSPLYSLTLSREASPRSTVSLTGEYGIATGGEIFDDLANPGEGGGGIDSVTGVGDYAEQSRLNAGWNVRWSRTTLAMNAYYSAEDYRNANTADIEREGIRIDLQHRVSPKLSGRLGASFESRDFTTSGTTDDNLAVELGVRWMLGRHAGIELDVQYYDRASDGATTNYDETRGFLRFTWGSGGAAGAQ